MSERTKEVAIQWFDDHDSRGVSGLCNFLKSLPEFSTTAQKWTRCVGSNNPKDGRSIWFYDPSVMSGRVKYYPKTIDVGWAPGVSYCSWMYAEAPRPPEAGSEHLEYLRAVRESCKNRSDNSVYVLDRAIDILARYENQKEKSDL